MTNLNNLNNVYDAIVIPTGEPIFGEQSFPVTKRAIELFKSGKYGCLFITGGYGGFATKQGISEARETYEYIMNNSSIHPDKIYYDEQSLESVGNFTFPLLYPLENEGTKNPSFSEFEKMQIIGQEGHIWRLKDYAELVFPEKSQKGEIDFYSIPGNHNNGLMARVYHRGLMNVLGKNKGAKEVHESLIKKHPFYSESWYDKGVNERKVLMALEGMKWNFLV